MRVGEQVLIAYFLRVEPQCEIFASATSSLSATCLIARSCWQEETCKSKCHLETFGIQCYDWVHSMFLSYAALVLREK